MSMLPIFIIGVLVGITLSYTWYVYKKDTPSDIKIKLQEKEIERQKSDNEILHNLINKLYTKIETLEKELESKK